MEEEEEDEAQSVSVTSSTVNERGPVRGAYEDEDSQPDATSELSQTHDLPRPGARRAEEEQEDDESTAGYDHSFVTQPQNSRVERPGGSRGLRLLLVALVTLLIVSAGSVAWLYLMTPEPQPAPRPPAAATREEAPPGGEGDSAETPPATGTGAASASATPPAPESGGTGTASATPESGTGHPRGRSRCDGALHRQQILLHPPLIRGARPRRPPRWWRVEPLPGHRRKLHPPSPRPRFACGSRHPHGR